MKMGEDMKTIRTVAIVLATLSVASPAQAANFREWPSWYWSMSGGLSYLERSDVTGGAAGELEHQNGGYGLVAVGYMPNASYQPFSGLRFEGELGYHHNSIDDFIPAGGASIQSSASTRSVSAMANVYYDFHNSMNITPYVGTGIGGTRIKLGRNAGMGASDDKDYVLAYQFMAGLFYTPPGIPTTQWGLGYRYFVQDSPEFPSAAGKIKLDDIASHGIEATARFRF